MFIERGRLFQGPRIEKDHHVELRTRLVAGPDALQISLHQPYGGESAGFVRRVHIADRGLIEMKGFERILRTSTVRHQHDRPKHQKAPEFHRNSHLRVISNPTGLDTLSLFILP
jgi:hypothetical protein